MKAKIKGRVFKVEKLENFVKLHFNLGGQVVDAQVTGRDCFLEGTLMLKPLVADQLKIGTVLTFEISEAEDNV